MIRGFESSVGSRIELLNSADSSSDQQISVLGNLILNFRTAASVKRLVISGTRDFYQYLQSDWP